jgi:transposase-like protein
MGHRLVPPGGQYAYPMGRGGCGTPDPEVVQKRRRRKFTAKYKLRILDEVEKCTQPGQIGSLLRREGLYSSNLTCWRKQRDEGILQGLTSEKERAEGQACETHWLTTSSLLERETHQLRKKLKRLKKSSMFKKKYRRSWGFHRKPTKGATHESRFSVGQ